VHIFDILFHDNPFEECKLKNIKAGSVQFNHSPGDKKKNLEIINSFVGQAAKKGVQLLVFPEMCITGYWHVRKLDKEGINALAESVPEGPSTQTLLDLSAKFDMTLGAGLIERSAEGRFYNTYIVAMPDGRTARHRKLHCFISEHMDSGGDFTVFDIPQGARVGVLICYDNNIFENTRITALKGAEILLAPHQTGGCDSPSPHCMGLIDPKLWEKRHEDSAAIEAEFRGPKGRDWLMRWLPSRAHDNGMFLIYANGVGLDDNEVRTGNAMILDPYGEILSETWKAADEMVVADLEARLLEMCTGSRWIRSRRPDLYESLTVATGSERDTRTLRFARERTS
jgi:predicted amidohydrolase